jgi:hypothetical protein
MRAPLSRNVDCFRLGGVDGSWHGFEELVLDIIGDAVDRGVDCIFERLHIVLVRRPSAAIVANERL